MTNPLADPYLVLSKVYGGGAYLKQALADTPVEEINRARTVKICYGVMENDLWLDACIRAFAPKSPKLPVRIVLKIALYMLLHMEKKRYMVTDNAVSLVKKLGKGGAAGFVNAFLRAFDEEKVPLPADPSAARALRLSFPPFLWKRLCAEYGQAGAERIASCRAQGITVRFASASAAEKYLAQGGYEATPFAGVYRFSSFRRDEGYDEGEYTFQSVGSVAVAAMVPPCKEVLDACAAPGGKSVLLSEKCGRVTAFELHPHRAQLIESYARRMHRGNIEAVCRDSSVYDGKYFEKFDAVLVDAPCSGSGVIAENPDIKFFRKEEDLKSIGAAQRAILDVCSAYVREGGLLFYSTCSVLKEENDGVVGDFLQKHKEFTAERADSPLAHAEKKYGIQFLPHETGGAGFYAAKLRKGGRA